MAHPIMFRYLSYSTTLAKHAVHRLRQCPAFGRAGTCLFLSVQLDGESVSDILNVWTHDHGPTNVRAMLKRGGPILAFGSLFVIVKMYGFGPS